MLELYQNSLASLLYVIIYFLLEIINEYVSLKWAKVTSLDISAVLKQRARNIEIIPPFPLFITAVLRIDLGNTDVQNKIMHSMSGVAESI